MLKFGEVLRSLREAHGWTIRELAQKSGVHFTSIAHYEKGRQLPRKGTSEKLGEALVVPGALLTWFAFCHQHIAPNAELFRRADQASAKGSNAFKKFVKSLSEAEVLNLVAWSMIDEFKAFEKAHQRNTAAKKQKKSRKKK